MSEAATATTPTLTDVKAFFANDILNSNEGYKPQVEQPKTPEPEAEEKAAPAAEEAEPVAAEPPAEDKTKTPESGTDTDKPKQAAAEDEELPENVKKKIEKETARAAKAQAAIDQAVSARKAKEAELAKLKADTPGSEPAKETTESANADEIKPFPSLDDFSGPDAIKQYNAAAMQWAKDFAAATEAKTRKTVTAELTAAQQEAETKQRWAEATKAHGTEFPDLMKSLAENTPKELQYAVSDLDNWSTVAVHLAKNEADRNSIVEKFKVSPWAAIAELGKLEARLTATPAKETPVVETKASDKKLPAPLKPVAGGPDVATDIDLQKVGSVLTSDAKKKISRGLGLV